ncbi:Adenylosuccinate synthetase [Xylariaceae sp. AK1471]|nr:Adenylosuccinate synthetase [Xylariaceae sp. AK1471]
MATVIWLATGKLTDILINEATFNFAHEQANLSGKHNAGLVIANGINIDFHLLPFGLVNPSCMNLIVPSFFKELETLEAKGLTNVRERILVSDRCQINLDLGFIAVHTESRRQCATIFKINYISSSTGRGIGPSYSTKAARSGIRRKLRKLADGYRTQFGDLLKYDVEDEIQRFRDYRPKLAEFCVDAVHLIHNMQKHNAKILVEGANALMLDIDYGTYPYVTSSNTGLGGIFTGLAIHPRKIDQIIGVAKAYIGAKLQTIGREWGASTGRKRRCVWIDLVVLKYSTAVNHYTCLNLSKLDVLDTFPTIKLAVTYKDAETGGILENFPADLGILERCEVVYHEMEGWRQPTTRTKTFISPRNSGSLRSEDLPKNAQAYIKLIEEHCGVPVAWIGTGPGREDIVARPILASI